jgi:hypothetical protein
MAIIHGWRIFQRDTPASTNCECVPINADAKRTVGGFNACPKRPHLVTLGDDMGILPIDDTLGFAYAIVPSNAKPI